MVSSQYLISAADDKGFSEFLLYSISFNNVVKMRAPLDEFKSKPEHIYPRGIEKPVECWEEAVNNSGEYTID